MVYSTQIPVGTEPSSPSAESGARRIFPSAIPAHAIFTPTPPNQDERWLNDIHVGDTAERAGFTDGAANT